MHWGASTPLTIETKTWVSGTLCRNTSRLPDHFSRACCRAGQEGWIRVNETGGEEQHCASVLQVTESTAQRHHAHVNILGRVNQVLFERI